MATEQTPPEPDLRAPRSRRRDLSTLLWLCGWGGATAIALSALAIASQTKTAGERLHQIFSINEPAAVAQMPPRVAQLEVRRASSHGTSADTEYRARPTDRTHRAPRNQHRRHDRCNQTASGCDCPCGQNAAAHSERSCHHSSCRHSARRTSESAIGCRARAASGCYSNAHTNGGDLKHGSGPITTHSGCHCAGGRTCTACRQPKRIRTRSRRRRYVGRRSPALDHGESQFRPAAERNVPACCP